MEGSAVTAAESSSSSDFVQATENLIDRAYAEAEAGRMTEAVKLFDAVRNFAEADSLQSRVDQSEAAFQAGVAKERDAFRSYVRQGNPVDPERSIVIFADSLGLPRPGEPLNVIGNDPTSYAFALREATKRRAAGEGAPKTSIDPICQRYATSETVLRNMSLTTLKGADVVVHVGLNDFSRRIFTERQRLAMKLLPNAVVNKIVRFSQANMYRADIIAAFPEHCYVSHSKWVENISKIAVMAREGGARSITWLSILQLPTRVEGHTPNYRYNVVRYNLALYDAARRGKINLLDVDRFFWERDFNTQMHSDQMHLSSKGHVFVCNRLIERLFGIAEYKVKE